MIPSWLHRLADNRFKGLSRRRPARRPARPAARLEVEALEERSSPTVVTWTGGNDIVNISSVHDILSNGNITRDGDPTWSESNNWQNFVRPQNNDDVVFPTGVPNIEKINTSSTAQAPPFNFYPYNSFNDNSLTLNSLTISDKDFDIGGNTITLKSELLGDNTFHGTTAIEFGIRLLGNPQSFRVNNSDATLFLRGELSDASGTSGIIKLGAGTVVLDGSNTFTGLTEVSQGTLVISNDNGAGDTLNGTVVRDGATLQVSGANVTGEALELVGNGVNGAGALLGTGSVALFPPDFNGYFDANGNHLGFAGNSLSVVNFSGGATWSGPITLSPSASVGVRGGSNLTLNGGISGGGDLTKVGTGTLILPTTNTYSGHTFINKGTLSLRADEGLADGSDTTVATGATLEVRGVLSVNESLILNGDGVLDAAGDPVGAFRSVGGSATNTTWTGPVLLASNTSVGGDNGSTITVTGNFSGAANLTKIGLSTFILPNANPNFTGNTTIGNGTTGGILIIRNGLSLGPTNGGGAITVLNPGTLQAEGTFTITKSLTLNGLGFNSGGALKLVGGTNTDVTWAGPIALGSTTSISTDPGSRLSVTGTIAGGSTATVEKIGTGTLVLTGANTYLGATTLREGVTIIQNGRALGGSSGGGTNVSSGATLQLGGTLNIPDETLSLTGSGVSGVGALHVTDGKNTWGGLVNLSGSDPAFVATDGTSQLDFTNIISGAAPLEKIGTGTLIISGTKANTATGSTLVDAGTLLLNKDANTQALGGDVTVGDGSGGQDADVARLLASNQIDDDSDVAVNKSGLFDLNGKSETISALALTGGHVSTAPDSGTGTPGTLTLGDNVTTNAAGGQAATISGLLSLGSATRTFTVADDSSASDDLVVNAVISGASGAGLTKAGAGTMLLNAANTYSGPTAVNGGTLKDGLANAIPTGTALSIGSSGTVGLNNFNQKVASLAGAGKLVLGTGNFTVGDASSTTFSGTLSGSGNLTKLGTGTLTLSGNSGSGFTGATAVNAGSLLVNGNLGSSAITVAAGATLGGSGTVGAVTVSGGTLSPGTSPGKLSTSGNVTLDGNSTFREEINGTTAGTNYDQLSVTGTASLGGAKLLTSFGYNASVGDSYTLVTTTAGVSGTFKDANGNTLNDLDTFVDNGRVYQIDYSATDVKLTMTAFVSQTSLASSQNPSTVGQSVTFTATISTPAPGAPNRTGTVSFFDGSTPLGNAVNVSSNQAKFTTTTLSAGTHTINASYSGDSNFLTSSTTLNPDQVVNKTSSTTTLDSSVNPADYGQSYTLTATVASSSGSGPVATGDVTFVDTTTGVTLGVRTLDGSGKAKLNIDGSSVAFLDAGLHTIKASYPGDNDYGASSGTFTETVNQVSTSTSVSASQGSSIYGEPVTYTATVSSSTTTPFGSVTFKADDGMGHVTTMGTKSLDANGKAALDFNALPVGTQTVTASFNANVDFKASSGTTSETVSQGTTTASLTTSKSPTVFGEPVTFTATISPNAPSTLPPAGSVTFVDTTTSTTLGTANLNAQGKAQLTVTSLASASGGMTHTIQASYNTDGNYATSSATVDQTVNPAPTTTTVTPSPNPSVFGQPVTITATVSASPSVKVPTGSVVFTIDGNPTGSVGVDGSGHAQVTMTFTTLGAHTISAAYSSNNTDNFLSSSSSQVTQQVNAAPTAVSVSSSRSPSQLGQSVTFTAIVSAPSSTAVPTGTVTFVIDGGSQATVGLNGAGQASFSTAGLPPGPHTIVVVFTPNSSNFLAGTSGPLTQVVRKDYYALALDVGGPGVVRVFDANTGAALADITAYAGYFGGVRVAVGDVNGDGFADIVTATAAVAPHIKVFSGADFSLLASFYAYDPTFSAGVFVAVGDINGDGRGDIITGAGGVAPHVKAFSGADFSLLASFYAYDPAFAGGVRVAAGDLNGDGRADIITATGSVAPHVKAFSGADLSLLASFYAYDPTFAAGVFVAAGDVDGDGRADIITGAGGVAPHVKVFSGGNPSSLLASFYAYPGSTLGVRVGAVDRNGDGRADIVTAPTGAPPHVRILDGLTLGDIDSFFAFGSPLGAVFVGGSA